MKMVGHDYKLVKLKSTVVAAGQDTLNQDFRNIGGPEELAPLPCSE
jgi:hypothetical protein